MKKTVVLRGPALTQSGYGVHTRQIARWLLQRPDFDVKFMTLPWGDTPWLLNGNLHGGLVGEIMKRTVPPDHKADISFQLQLPNEWDPKIARVNIGITAGVETDRCNPEWVQACNAMTAVVVPSQHSKLSLTNTGRIERPLLVIPEAFSDSCAVSNPTSEFRTFSTDFNFLVFGQLTGNNPENDRKNIFYTIKWLTEAFKNDPQVGIVVKTNVGKNSLIDRNLTRGLITAVVNDSRKGTGGPKVHLVHGDMKDEEVTALYRHPQIKALVSLTRGEGYGLPILEAAACGLPVITTGWSGHLDFLRHGKYVSIFHQLADVHPSRIDGKIFVKGARWAAPSEDDFKKRVVKFRNSPTTPKEWANELATVIQEKYSLKSVMSMYDQELKDYIG